MENRNFYNQILTEHNLHPEHKAVLEGETALFDQRTGFTKAG